MCAFVECVWAAMVFSIHVLRRISPWLCSLCSFRAAICQRAELQYPLPWAEEKEGSAISSVEDYNLALTKVGFSLTYEEDKTDFAIDFFEKMSITMSSSDGPSPVGLHLLMGELTKQKIGNMAYLIKSGVIAPRIIISKK